MLEKWAIAGPSIIILHVAAAQLLEQKACGLTSSLFIGQSLASGRPARLEIVAERGVKTNLFPATNTMDLSALLFSNYCH